MASKNIFKVGLVLALLVAMGKLLAFAKDICISYYFGISYQTDAYFVANFISSLIFSAFYATISLVFLPLYNEKMHLSGNEGAHRFASIVINLYFLISCVLLATSIYFAPLLVTSIAHGLNQKTTDLAVQLVRILSFSYLFSAVIGIITSIQYANKNYYAAQALPIINNLIVVVVMVLFASQLAIYAVAIGAVAGWAIQFLLQVFMVKGIFSYTWGVDLKDEYIQKLSWLCVPAFIGLTVEQLNGMVATMLVSSLDAGSVSVLNYAMRMSSLASSVLVMVVATLMYPIYSDYVVKKNFYFLGVSVGKTIRIIGLLAVPLTLISVVFTKEITAAIFMRGAFDMAAVLATAKIYFYFGLGIIFVGLKEVLNRVFYAMNDVRTPLVTGGVVVIINVLLSLYLIRLFGAAGLALATSIATFLGLCLQLYILKIRLGRRFYKGMSRFTLKLAIAAGGMYTVFFIFNSFMRFSMNYLYIIFCLIFMVAAYGFILYFSGVREVSLLKSKFSKFGYKF